MSDILRTKAMLLTSDLSRWERMILVYLGDLADDDGSITARHLDCVAAISGATSEHVSSVCNALEELGLVEHVSPNTIQLRLD